MQWQVIEIRPKSASLREFSNFLQSCLIAETSYIMMFGQWNHTWFWKWKQTHFWWPDMKMARDVIAIMLIQHDSEWLCCKDPALCPINSGAQAPSAIMKSCWPGMKSLCDISSVSVISLIDHKKLCKFFRDVSYFVNMISWKCSRGKTIFVIKKLALDSLDGWLTNSGHDFWACVRLFEKLCDHSFWHIFSCGIFMRGHW